MQDVLGLSRLEWLAILAIVVIAFATGFIKINPPGVTGETDTCQGITAARVGC